MLYFGCWETYGAKCVTSSPSCWEPLNLFQLISISEASSHLQGLHP